MPPINPAPVNPNPADPMGQLGAFLVPGQPAAAPAFGPTIPNATMTQPTPNQAAPVKAQAPRPASTQNSLLLSELRENMVIMADGSFRAVVACKSINFDLMSSREREGIEFSYQNFLNALYFPIQIFIRSQRVDIGPYIDKLEEVRRTQENMLLSVLMDDYINFIDTLSQEANIMDKSFFIIVPYFPTGDATNVVAKGKGFLAGFLPNKGVSPVTKIDKMTYDKAKDEIRNRVDSVINGLAQVGVSAVQLTTKELGELYYNVYNPDTAVREPLGDFSTVTSTYSRKGQNPTDQTAVTGVQNG